MTNRERINLMSDRQLARFMSFCRCSCAYNAGGGECTHANADCIRGRMKWLKSEAKINQRKGKPQN